MHIQVENRVDSALCSLCILEGADGEGMRQMSGYGLEPGLGRCCYAGNIIPILSGG